MTDPNPPSEAHLRRTATFEDLPLDPTLRRGVREMGYHEPTPIQQGTIPHAVEGRDLIGTAQTGTGKTAAFLLPILERLLSRPRGRIYALVLTPTRELALQAEGFLRQLGRHTRLRGAAVYGGVGMADQERALRGGAEIIVATPGRLLDHLERGYVDLSALEILVLDEGDRMLDMGFLPDVRRILGRLPRQRQTMLFSATMPPEIVRLAHEFLHDPRIVRVDPTVVAAAGVSHHALRVPAEHKTAVLLDRLKDPAMSSVLVFARTKHRADRLARQLEHARIGVAVIHGNRSQSQRVRALEGFRAGRYRVLVATDIAARGVDVEGVSHVVNYDVPHEPEAYVHRVGRTARAQRRGDALTLVAREEQPDFARIESLLGFSMERDAPPAGLPAERAPLPVPGRRAHFGPRRDASPPPRDRPPQRRYSRF
ncbi:MAG TPA: DEAD/DEAH box helicase [Thermoplasmata archaeon]|nr:DEAD/DEAH box helicase [Thermoplasmata archaeon]HTW55452.1 DEAD/DEAH box helicase [Thermoplasmata archaeon]